ncbi:transaldolase [Atopobacter sp. AH10]|uniref:transaldolase n=1 Tax=Atopobacter sp. AH10 TaxID=2315861 RepID=UPI0018F74F84|nr:transaldolase [Atopobacter sp. AH10]
MEMTELATAIYSDGASIDDMLEALAQGTVTGFTTNPSLMKKSGVTSYTDFASEVVRQITDYPVSFEVFKDDLEGMRQEALKISSLGSNVYVKIPVINSKGESTASLIKELSQEGVKLNVTAIFTVEQVREVVDHLTDGVDSIVSVFAGRLADAGIDPIPVMKEALAICREKKGCQLLWASTREVYNIYQAEQLGVDIITCPPAVIKKYEQNQGKTALEGSLETVQGFMKDIKSLGFSIL